MKNSTLSLILCLFLCPIFTPQMSAVGTVNETNILVKENSFGEQVKNFFKNKKSQIDTKVRKATQWAKAKSKAMKDKIKAWRNLWIWGWILGGLFSVVGSILAFVSVGIASGSALAVSAGLLVLGALGIAAGTVGLIVFLVKNSE